MDADRSGSLTTQVHLKKWSSFGRSNSMYITSGMDGLYDGTTRHTQHHVFFTFEEKSIVFKFSGFGSLRRVSSGYADEEDVKVCFFFIDKASILKRVWFGQVQSGSCACWMLPDVSSLPWFGAWFALAPWPGLFWPIDKFETQFLKDFQIALLMHLPFYNFPKGVQNLCRVSGGELIRIHKDLQGILVIHVKCVGIANFVLPLSQLHPIVAEWAHCKCQLVALVIVDVLLVVYWSIDLSYEVKNLNSWVISMDVTL